GERDTAMGTFLVEETDAAVGGAERDIIPAIEPHPRGRAVGFKQAGAHRRRPTVAQIIAHRRGGGGARQEFVFIRGQHAPTLAHRPPAGNRGASSARFHEDSRWRSIRGNLYQSNSDAAVKNSLISRNRACSRRRAPTNSAARNYASCQRSIPPRPTSFAFRSATRCAAARSARAAPPRSFRRASARLPTSTICAATTAASIATSIAN